LDIAGFWALAEDTHPFQNPNMTVKRLHAKAAYFTFNSAKINVLLSLTPILVTKLLMYTLCWGRGNGSSVCLLCHA
jgi:hypothetical protein